MTQSATAIPLNFPDTEVGSVNDISLKVRNDDPSLTPGTFSLNGGREPMAGAFHVRGRTSFQLDPDQEVELPVRFQPTRFGVHEASLVLTCQFGGGQSEYRYLLTGQAVPPRRLSYVRANVAGGSTGKTGPHHHIVVSDERYLRNLASLGVDVRHVVTIPAGTEGAKVKKGTTALRPGEFFLDGDATFMNDADVIAYGFYLQRVEAREIDYVHVDVEGLSSVVKEVVQHSIRNPLELPPCARHCVDHQALRSTEKGWLRDIIWLGLRFGVPQVPRSGDVIAVPRIPDDPKAKTWTEAYVVVSPPVVTEYLWSLHRDNVIALAVPAMPAESGDVTQLGVIRTRANGRTPELRVDVHAFGLYRIRGWSYLGRIRDDDLDDVRDGLSDFLGVRDAASS